VEGLLSGEQIHDVSVAAELTGDITERAVTADRGYDSDGFRREVEGNNNTAVIPGRRNRKK
jgi:hypothetical protein